MVTGLAWTEAGGDTLQIEAVMLPGKGRMQTTGKLGDVMKESIDAARSYVRSKATTFGIKPTDVRHQGHPRPRAGRRHPQGRPLGRRGDGGVDRLGAHRHCRAPRRGDDGRSDVARARPADRRAEGKAARGPARRHQDGHHPAGEREGPGRNPRQRESGAEDRAGVQCRRSAQGRAGAPARADRLGRTGGSWFPPSCRTTKPTPSSRIEPKTVNRPGKHPAGILPRK